MGLNCRIEQGNVALDRSRHRLAVLLPARGAAFDIGERGAVRQKLDHRPYPKAFSARGQSRIVHVMAARRKHDGDGLASAVAVWDAEESTRSQQSRTPTRWALARFPIGAWLHRSRPGLFLFASGVE